MSQHRRGQPSFKPGFPSMSVDELCDCLFALGISAHVEDLHKPNPQSAQAIYAGLLDALMSANVESMEQPKAALMGLMEYKVGPDLRWEDQGAHMVIRIYMRTHCHSRCSSDICRTLSLFEEVSG
jgi:hypothetical protein